MLINTGLIEKQLITAKRRRRKMYGFLALLTAIVFTLVAWYLRLTGITLTEDINSQNFNHIHSESCYAEVCLCSDGSTSHTHTDGCFDRELVCTLTQYDTADKSIDTESSLQWESTLPQTIADTPANNFISVAKSQLGYTESDANFIFTDSDNTKHGYTRYGEWYGNPYCEWNAEFISFCLYYSSISAEEIPYAPSGYTWVTRLKQTGQFIEVCNGSPVPGDLVFFTNENNICHVAIITVVTLLPDGSVSSLEIIEGDYENSVQARTYTDTDRIIGFCSISAKAAETSPVPINVTQTPIVMLQPDNNQPPTDITSEAQFTEAVTTQQQVAQAEPELSYSELPTEETFSHTDTIIKSEQEQTTAEHADTTNAETVYAETDKVDISKAEVLKAETDEAEQPRCYSYNNGTVRITVSVPPQTVLPENAVLTAYCVSADTNEYISCTQTAERIAEADVVAHMVYSIGFTVDGVEIEPSQAPVDVSFEFTEQALADPQTKASSLKIQVVHMVDEVTAHTVDSRAEISHSGSVESLTFSTDSFSEFDIMLLSLSTLPAGSYGQCTFAYNDTLNAFCSDSDYSTYYNNESPLGVAGSFSLVAYDTLTLSSHCNGNILANTLIANSNFGTNGLAHELTYIRNYERVNGVSASSNDHIIVIGSENTVTTRDNGNSLAVNETKLDRPKHIIQDTDSDTSPFIDLQAAQAESFEISAELAQMSTDGVTASFSDVNNMYIRLNSPDGAGYYNMTASALNTIGGNARNLRMKGFEADHDGSIIVNVDCTGFTGTLSMPNSTVWVDEIEQLTNEVTSFSNGKVIWNFINADSLTIETNRMTGMVLAPGATIQIRQNLNGTVIADNIEVYAESHRTDFTGTVLPEDYSWSVALSANKTIDGEPAEDESFSFRLENLNTGSSAYEWQSLQTAVQNDGIVDFNSLSINTGGTYWYSLTEQQTGPSGYEYSQAVFIIRVITGNRLSADVTFFSLDSAYTKAQLISGNSINTDYLSEISPSEAVFDNARVTAYELPSTGGCGGLVFIAMGAVTMLGVALFFYLSTVHNRCRKAIL